MKNIQCHFHEILNREGLDFLTYVNLETCSLEVHAVDEVEESDVLRQIPYVNELYSENKVLNEYISEQNICIPESMSARKYLRETGQIFDFQEFFEKILREKMTEWFRENHVEIVFNA